MAQGLWSLFSLQLPEFLFFFFLLPHPNLFKKQTPLPLNNNFTVSIASSLWSLISNKSWMGYSQGPVSMHLSKFGSHLPLWSFLEPPDLELNSAEIIKTTYGFSWAESDRAHPSKNSQTTRARKKGRTGEYIWAAAAAAAKSLRLCPTLCNPRRQPTRLPRPWDSPGKNTGMGCHCLLDLNNSKNILHLTIFLTMQALFRALRIKE